MNPLSHFKLGQLQHEEYEAQQAVPYSHSGRRWINGRTLKLASVSIGLIILTILLL